MPLIRAHITAITRRLNPIVEAVSRKPYGFTEVLIKAIFTRIDNFQELIDTGVINISALREWIGVEAKDLIDFYKNPCLFFLGQSTPQSQINNEEWKSLAREVIKMCLEPVYKRMVRKPVVAIRLTDIQQQIVREEIKRAQRYRAFATSTDPSRRNDNYYSSSENSLIQNKGDDNDDDNNDSSPRADSPILTAVSAKKHKKQLSSTDATSSSFSVGAQLDVKPDSSSGSVETPAPAVARKQKVSKRHRRRHKRRHRHRKRSTYGAITSATKSSTTTKINDDNDLRLSFTDSDSSDSPQPSMPQYHLPDNLKPLLKCGNYKEMLNFCKTEVEADHTTFEEIADHLFNWLLNGTNNQLPWSVSIEIRRILTRLAMHYYSEEILPKKQALCQERFEESKRTLSQMLEHAEPNDKTVRYEVKKVAERTKRGLRSILNKYYQRLYLLLIHHVELTSDLHDLRVQRNEDTAADELSLELGYMQVEYNHAHAAIKWLRTPEACDFPLDQVIPSNLGDNNDSETPPVDDPFKSAQSDSTSYIGLDALN